MLPNAIFPICSRTFGLKNNCSHFSHLLCLRNWWIPNRRAQDSDSAREMVENVSDSTHPKDRLSSPLFPIPLSSSFWEIKENNLRVRRGEEEEGGSWREEIIRGKGRDGSVITSCQTSRLLPPLLLVVIDKGDCSRRGRRERYRYRPFLVPRKQNFRGLYSKTTV